MAGKVGGVVNRDSHNSDSHNGGFNKVRISIRSFTVAMAVTIAMVVAAGTNPAMVAMVTGVDADPAISGFVLFTFYQRIKRRKTVQRWRRCAVGR